MPTSCRTEDPVLPLHSHCSGLCIAPLLCLQHSAGSNLGTPSQPRRASPPESAKGTQQGGDAERTGKASSVCGVPQQHRAGTRQSSKGPRSDPRWTLVSAKDREAGGKLFQQISESPHVRVIMFFASITPLCSPMARTAPSGAPPRGWHPTAQCQLRLLTCHVDGCSVLVRRRPSLS